MGSNCFSIEDLRIDGLPSGKLFCASVCPSFSWRMISPYFGTMQQCYRIVAKNVDSEELLWDSGIVESDISTGIRWGGDVLPSRYRVKWQVA